MNLKKGEKKKTWSLTWWRSIDRLCSARPKLPGSKGRTRTAWAPCSRRPRTRCAIPRCIHPRGRTRYPLLARCSRCSRLRPRCSRCWHVRSVDRSRAAPRKSSLSGGRDGREGGVHARTCTTRRPGLITAEIRDPARFVHRPRGNRSFGGGVPPRPNLRHRRNYARHLLGHDNNTRQEFAIFSFTVCTIAYTCSRVLRSARLLCVWYICTR